MCAGFPSGTGDAHRFVNNSSADVLLLVIGDRTASDVVSYPDIDLHGKLGKLRKSLGFTQATLAAKLDLRESVVRRAETGNLPLSIEQTERYRRIASQHGIDLDQLAA
jgi:DNA-binding XRE family transcriptional regulator